ncbi:MAG: restriction endonuclease [Planctomycetota bacterium]|jgi:restriction endonuclease Mrr
MVEVRCRRCGEVVELPEYHGATTVVCRHCNWRESYPARRRIPEKLTHEAGAAFKAHQRHDALVASAVDRLQELSSQAFERFCGRLFELLGHTVIEADPVRAQSHVLELREGESVTYVACKRTLGQETIGLEEVENLAGAMRHDGVRHGIFVTTGSFADSCPEVAEKAGIELIDHDALCRRVGSVELGQEEGTEGLRD